MRNTKIYPAEKVEKVAQILSNVPALPVSYVTKEVALKTLSKQIKELYFKKNYDAHQIVNLLKDSGLKFKLKEIQEFIKNMSEKPEKKQKRK